jgi:alkaline phosphatase
VTTAGELAAAAPDARVLGLFAASHMSYESARPRGADGEPSLADMTAAAIRRLSREPNGYVLLVEGGRIDHAHHDGRAADALSETVAYDEAIRTALEMTSREDTLIIATADHSHTLTMAGYAQRGNPILGLSADASGLARARDGRPYTTLGYANGPGAVFPAAPPNGEPQAVTRPDLSDADTQAFAFRQQALVPMTGESHGGEDVAIYAWGPGDAAVAGTMEQNAVFHVMARALGFSWR